MIDEKPMDRDELKKFLEVHKLCRMSRDEAEIVMWFRLLKEANLGDKAKALLQALTATAAFEGKRASLIEATKENKKSAVKVKQIHKAPWDGAPLACWALPDLTKALDTISLTENEQKLVERLRIQRIQKRASEQCKVYLESQFGIPPTYAHLLMRNCCEMPSGDAQYRSRADTIHCPAEVKSLTEAKLIIVPVKQVRARQMGKVRSEQIAKKNAAKKSAAGEVQKVAPKKVVTQKKQTSEDFEL